MKWMLNDPSAFRSFSGSAVTSLCILLASGCTGGEVSSSVDSSQAPSSAAVVSSSSEASIAVSSSSVVSSAVMSSSEEALSSHSSEASSEPPLSSSSSSVASVPDASQLVYAVNAGGAQLTAGGVTYHADRFADGGMPNSTADAIAGTTDDALYQSERYGQYAYQVPVTDATYTVVLHFNEMYQEAEGSRYFSATLEGQQLFTALDLFAEVGHDVAFDLIVPDVAVNDGNLTISLAASLDNATLSGFAIYSSDGGQFVEPPEPETCELPSRFEWEASAPLISPRGNNYGIKDPSIVQSDGLFHVFATVNDGDWRSVYLNFADWAQASSAAQQPMSGTRGGNTVAPQVFYYRPHNLWYNFTQWPRGYNTTTDISDVNSWTSRVDFLRNGPPSEPNKPELDYWNICDDTHCHVFFSRDDGVLYKSKTTRANFPNFDGYEIVMEDHRGNGASFLFEAANVYKVDGQDLYLLLVEAYRTPGYGPRYFRSWTAPTLDGPWTALADTEENPFAGEANVTWPAGNKWATGISHGEMIRSGYDEYMTIDPCNMQYLFQGDSGESLDGSYGGEPYKLGLLKLRN
ncbi:MAG TPA: non-reducing end alpha-L-arabinofuranosidase family hydrolase [Marinagarivorans sp.]